MAVQVSCSFGTQRRRVVFTRQELIATFPGLAVADSPPLEVAYFPSRDFITPDCEESIWVFRGWKRDFTSDLLFWVKALQAQDWSGREDYLVPYAEGGLCEPITEAECIRLVTEYSSGLRSPLPPYIADLSGFRSGLRMYAEWYDVAAVAELDEMFVAFCWSTTA
ncbi:hypothetical protein C1280_11565 [Gemmata obscuriglobus]|uniref:Uncharacterized protein n=1 Tax=Gemmata obscuriglobus TaxID=114 RepID=A0A2Z3HCT0_9BACT|nr:hypothetical protein C1280_11565 [Gemmata obscuriglobus]VTS08951.1 Uncharacterized protein OS=Pseudomonas sp. GM25 GN=PMI24_04634 PE=4 SV=1 [Gemmata obscuriglobus UQM 2246]